MIEAPVRLQGSPVVQHVGKRHQHISAWPTLLQHNRKVAAGHHGPSPHELRQRGHAGKLWRRGEDGLVVASDGVLAVGSLRGDVGPLQVAQLLL